MSEGRSENAAAIAAEPEAGASTAAAAVTRAAADPARSKARREMGVALLLVLAGAGLTLALGGRVWAEGAASVHGTRIAVEATATTVNKAPFALALFGLAGGLATFATRGRWRVVVGVALALGGAGIVAAALAGASDRSAVDAEAASKAAVEGVRAIDVTHTVWPWFTAAAGVLMLVGGLLVALRGRTWPGMSSRYEAPGGQEHKRVKPTTSADLWNALDRGEDPTR
ncbi:TIGR02234 family membrane protein [Yinghuangia seranimata]|uniref:TIGR02234 family membrane protein n=1 Tax=Yinghuangia seranimata TaxID=408067 RepID=UPI00248C3DFC|nr:TIGR02234 family membrane protein [Yinghuangia seranimata]MDI2126237.1 TIGR02234 family membrane protein [Yinghuangia seranimata]